jgi:hypothetical protein
MATDLRLPEKSPFYRDETPDQASARLRAIYDTSKLKGTAKQQADDLAKALKQLADKPERKSMCIGAAILEPAAQPIFAGVNAQNLVSVGSIAKLSLLYAAFQLRADVGVIATSDGVADSSDPTKRITSLVDAVQAAFQQAKEPELRAIGSTPANMPRLARILDLGPFLQTPSKERVAQRLDFTYGFTTGLLNPRPDDYPFDSRLRDAVSSSVNEKAMSCICDVGLPYIQALLKRTGFASLHGRQNPGLWLAWLFGNPSDLHRRPITGLDPRYYSTITTGASAGKWLPTQPPAGDKSAPKQQSQKSGHVATALGLATFLTLLHRDQLFEEPDSGLMRGYLTRRGWLAQGFQGLGNGGASSKVGIIMPIYSDCALVDSTALRKPVKDPSGADAGSSQAPAQTLPRTHWIAVGLNAQGNPKVEFDDNGILKDLGRDLEAAVASVVQPS